MIPTPIQPRLNMLSTLIATSLAVAACGGGTDQTTLGADQTTGGAEQTVDSLEQAQGRRSRNSDNSPPTVTVTSQGTVDSLGAVTIVGQATDNWSVKRVSWATDTGGSGITTLSGSNTSVTWSASDVPLQVGDNRLTFTAQDGAGNTSNTSIVVTRGVKSSTTTPEPPPGTTTVPASAPVSAASRAAVLAYGKQSADMQAVVGKFGFAVMNMWPSMGVPYMQGMINNLRAINPSIKLATYVLFNELIGDAPSNDDSYAAVNKVSAAPWWVRDAAGNRVQWTDAYGAYEVNVTNWAPVDSTGKRWPQWKAEFDTTSLLGKLSGLNYIFIDNVMWQPRYDADLMRKGTNQSGSDPIIQAAFRTGYANYFGALRTLNPSLRLMGNADNDLSYPEFKGKLNGAFLECQMGKSWSIETWGGWGVMMKRYRDVIANTTDKEVVFEACGISGANPAQARYGFASVLLEDGYFAYSVNGLDSYWADEFSAPLGTPNEAPPTAATPSGIWKRGYTNGLTLVNPTASNLTIDVGAGYKYLTGTKDPLVNNGQPARVVTMPPKSGLILVKL